MVHYIFKGKLNAACGKSLTNAERTKTPKGRMPWSRFRRLVTCPHCIRRVVAWQQAINRDYYSRQAQAARDDDERDYDDERD